jgi:hypothetical protein
MQAFERVLGHGLSGFDFQKKHVGSSGMRVHVRIRHFRFTLHVLKPLRAEGNSTPTPLLPRRGGPQGRGGLPRRGGPQGRGGCSTRSALPHHPTTNCPMVWAIPMDSTHPELNAR